jgi:gamma-tubulin complex component 3
MTSYVVKLKQSRMVFMQEILTQLRTIFDLIINFQSIQEAMYRAAKEELSARQSYEQSKIRNTEKV